MDEVGEAGLFFGGGQLPLLLGIRKGVPVLAAVVRHAAEKTVPIGLV